MSLPAWCRAEHVRVMQHTEEEVRGTRSAGEAGVCVGWLVCVVGLFCACVQHKERVCVHTRVHWSKAVQGVWEAPVGPCGGTLLRVPGGVCVCHEGVWLRTAPMPAWQRIGSAGLALAPSARWHCWAEAARARGRNVGFILPFPNEPGRWNGGADKLPVSWEGEGCSQNSS